MGCPNVSRRSRLGIGVQTAQTQDHLWLIGPLGHQVGPAFSAEMPDLPGRRLEVAEKFRASTPFEVSPFRASGRRECRAVSFSASLAIAVDNGPREPSCLECHRSTKTASIKHLNFLWRSLLEYFGCVIRNLQEEILMKRPGSGTGVEK